MSIAFDKLKCWTPCEEGLPCELEPVLITYKNNEPESYYANIKGKPFTAVAYYYDKKWWWYSTRCADLLAEYGCSITDAVDKGIEIVAWAPLPPPYGDCNR